MSAAPERKVIAGGLAGAVATVLIWIASVIWPTLVIPSGVEAAIVTILLVAVAYLVPNAPAEAPAGPVVEVPHG